MSEFNLKEALLKADAKGDIADLYQQNDRVVNLPLEDEAPDPKPLPNELLPVEPFDFAMMPDTLAPWAKDIAERMGCPPDYVAATVMTMIGAVVGGKIHIRPKKLSDDWKEAPNQWAMLVGRPGTLKSPAMEEALAPLRTLEAKANEAFKEQSLDYEADTEAENIMYEQRKKEARKAKTKEEAKEKLLQKPEPIEPPTRKRYRTNDTTAAALGALLIENPNGLLAYRDELASLLGDLDREENAGARGFYLSGWNGTGQYTIDRIARGRYLHIPQVTLSLLGSTQPGRIAGYINRALSGGKGDDGLIQRFGLMVWPDNDRPWEDVDREPDREAKSVAYGTVGHLDTFDPLEIGAEQDTDLEGQPKSVPFLRFNDEALVLFRQWRSDHENKTLRDDALHPALESHFAKYRKLVPTLALLTHLAEHGTGPIPRAALLKALAWSEYLKSHARRMYGSVTRLEVLTATKILARIKKGELQSPFKGRDVYRRGWAGLTNSKVVVGGLQMLVDYDWLFSETLQTTGRPATIYTVNPKAITR